MIPKAIDAITKSDIEALIENAVREGRTIEYKRDLPGNSDNDKREFLADVSSFANAGGGDLLYGVSEVDGTPEEARGLDCNIDAEMLRLENIVRDGLEPRIPGVHMRPVDGFPEGSVILIRIPKSWSAPHMVTFKNLSRFFSRNSAGKYQMEVSEIRSAFSLSEALPERMKRFRDERLGRIIADETPVLLCEGARLILHILPVTSFSPGFSLDVSTLSAHTGNLRPIGRGGWNPRFNLDGFMTYRDHTTYAKFSAYCQIFRSGQIELVYTDFVSGHEGGKLFIASLRYKRDAIEAVLAYLGVLKALDVPCPLSILLSMVGVSGARIVVQPADPYYVHAANYDAAPIDRDTLILPDILIEDYDSVSDESEVARALRPAFDAVWNACGYPHSFNFDEEGNWKSRR